MISAIEFTKGISDADVFGIVKSKFGYEYESCPVVMFVVDKNPQLDIHRFILFFGPTISVSIKDRKESLLDV